MTDSADLAASSDSVARPPRKDKDGFTCRNAVRWFFTFGLPMYAIVLAFLFMAATSLWGIGQRAQLLAPQTVRDNGETSARPAAKPSVGLGTDPSTGAPPGPSVVANSSEQPTSSPSVASSRPQGAIENSGDSAFVAGHTAAAVSSEISAVSTVAKLALDTTKERVDGMKDTYDRLFAMIAALGALLAFLGFKGFESFTLAKKHTAETVEKAELAVAKANAAKERAERAKEQADEAVKKLNFFIDVEYPRNNVAEIEVARGIIMREIAGVYQAVAKRCGQDIKDYPEYRKAIDLGLIYLKNAVAEPERLEPETVSRALITMGNLYRRMSNIHGAVEACQRVVKEFSPNDTIAHYNLACYYCLLAEQEEKGAGSAHQVQAYAASAIAALERAIELDSSNRADARTDDDFVWFQSHPAFKALVAMGPQPTKSGDTA